jgi:tape measure domain-containing protein
MGRYEYILQLQDKMSGTLQRVGSTGRRVFDDLQQRQERINTTTAGFGNILGKLGIAFSALSIGRSIVGAASNIQNARVEFQTLLQDVEAGNKMLADVTEFAAKTPMQTGDLRDAAKMMLSFGIAQDKIMPNLKMIGDVSGGNAQKFNSLTLAFSQMSSAGRLMGQDLLQMINAGFNPLQEISKKTGKSMSVLKKEMEAGKISSQMVSDAFRSATQEGGMFYGMMEKQSQTIGGKWSTLMDKVTLTFSKLGDKATPIINFVIDKLSQGADMIIPILKGIAQPFSWLFDQIQRGNQFITIATVLLAGWTAGIWIYKGAMLAVGIATKIWTAIQWGLNAAFMANPIGLIIAAIVALIAAIAYVAWKTDGWGKAWSHVTKGAELTFKAFTGGVKHMFNTMVDGIMIGINNIMLAYYKVKEAAGIGDSAANKKQIANIQSDIARRKNEIVTGATQVVKDAVMGAAHFAAAGQSLSWNKDRSFSDLTDGIKSKLGMGEASGMGSPEGTGLSPGGDDGTAKEITSGGSRPTTINITLGNLVETLTINASGIREGATEMERMVQEAMLRVLNSANGVAYGN